MSTPIVRGELARGASSLGSWPAWSLALACIVTAAVGCKEDPASPGNPPTPPTTGGVGSKGNGGSPSGGSGSTLGTGGTTGGGSTTTGKADATIELWYGDDQTFGTANGPAPQRWVNVLGDLGADFLEDASYSVNGGPEEALPLGPDTERLSGPGHFNIELDRATLRKLPEVNTVAITVTVSGGDYLTKDFAVRVHEAGHAKLPFEADWSGLADVAQVNQIAAIVDGEWALEGDGVAVVEKGYDRLIAVGDQTWAGNYEVLASFTVTEWNAWGAVGLAVGWQGHTGDAAPRVDWPVEGLTWVRNVVPEPELQIMTFERSVQERKPFALELETEYYLRAHTKRMGQSAAVSMRVWRADRDEPGDWQLSSVTNAHDGSVLLIAHHATVTWGKVSVEAVR
jgi:hypothetical protein